MSIRVQLTAIAVALTLGLSGCASSSASTSNVNNSLKKDEPSFFSQSGATACATGGIISGLACLLLSGGDHDKCIAVAVAGCAIAMTGNYALDKLRADYHNLEDQLDATKGKIQESIKSTDTLKESTKETLAQDSSDIDNLVKDIKAGNKSVSALNSKTKEMEANLDYILKRLASDQENLKAQQDAYTGLKKGKGGVAAKDVDLANAKEKELDESILSLNNNIAEMYDLADQYSKKIAFAKTTANTLSAG